MVLPMVAPHLLQLKESIAKREAQKNMKICPLQTIRLKKRNVAWVEAEKEILIDGQLFDIKEIRETKTEITVTGIFDKEETFLQNLSENITGKEKKEQGILLTEYFKFLNNNHIQNEPTLSRIPLALSITYPNENIGFHKDCLIKVPLPPPKI